MRLGNDSNMTKKLKKYLVIRLDWVDDVLDELEAIYNNVDKVFFHALDWRILLSRTLLLPHYTTDYEEIVTQIAENMIEEKNLSLDDMGKDVFIDVLNTLLIQFYSVHDTKINPTEQFSAHGHIDEHDDYVPRLLSGNTLILSTRSDVFKNYFKVDKKHGYSSLSQKTLV